MCSVNKPRTLEKFGHRGERLELEEAPLEHVFGVDLLDAHQVQDHVVREVERAIQRVGLALYAYNTHELLLLLL